MGESSSQSWRSQRRTATRRTLRQRAVASAVGTATGVLGGMGAYLFVSAQFLPVAVRPPLFVGIALLAGVFASVLVPNLPDATLGVMVGGFVVMGVMAVCWVAPSLLSPWASEPELGLALARGALDGLIAGTFPYVAGFGLARSVEGVLGP